MYRVILYVTLTLLTILNVNLHKDATPGIDKELQPYVDTFLEYCDYYHVNCDKTLEFRIKLVKMHNYEAFYKMIGIGKGGNVIGHCWTKSNEIDINIDYFAKANSAEIEQVMLHELGHCILDLEHTKEDTVTMMNPYNLYYEAYIHDYNEIMNDFFGCKDNCPQLQFNQNKY